LPGNSKPQTLEPCVRPAIIGGVPTPFLCSSDSRRRPSILELPFGLPPLSSSAAPSAPSENAFTVFKVRPESYLVRVLRFASKGEFWKRLLIEFIIGVRFEHPAPGG
ncbi:hypothetical protein Taro_035564, partial [Colocasia esculenta]|nr:hypothetical protein [Colocasia esculenta]